MKLKLKQNAYRQADNDFIAKFIAKRRHRMSKYFTNA